MKSDGAAKRVSGADEAGAFRVFFERLDEPAALLNADGTLREANAAFQALFVDRGGRSSVADWLKGALDGSVKVGGRQTLEATGSSGRRIELSATRQPDFWVVVGRALVPPATKPALERELLELTREIAGAVTEEELVAAVARGVRGLFPGRAFCIRISDEKTHALTSVYAEGKLADSARAELVLKRSAARKTHLMTRGLRAERVRIVDGELPRVFEGTDRSICAPLVASGQLFGAINIEYPPGFEADFALDERNLFQLANQVAVAVRTAKLIDELTFVRKYLEELLEHANALIVVVDRDRRVVVFNKAFSTLTGLARRDVLGEDLLGFIPEGERMRLTRAISASLGGEQASNFETRVVGRAGREVRVAFATSSVLTARGEVEGVIAIGQDLTRTKELERRMIQAENLAALGQMAASVVHEINNPMTAVATYADALLARAATQPKTDAGDIDKLKKILSASDRILRFTRDLMSLARPSSDRPEQIDLHRTLDAAAEFCEHVLEKHGIAVERDYGPAPKIAAVPGSLVQAFVNLITNAAHAMKPGGAVKLGTRHEAGDVIITVEDGGTGIDPARIERIFEPFFTTKADGRGTGLGLSIVQSIVENHGGTISVKSELGTGTTFTLRLPAGG